MAPRGAATGGRSKKEVCCKLAREKGPRREGPLAARLVSSPSRLGKDQPPRAQKPHGINARAKTLAVPLLYFKKKMPEAYKERTAVQEKGIEPEPYPRMRRGCEGAPTPCASCSGTRGAPRRAHGRKGRPLRHLPRLLTDRTLRGGGVLAVRATAPASSS
jgi:hypothetical protein